MRNVAPNVFARILTVGLRLVPVGKHIMVYGVPSTEGNVVEVARSLVKLTTGPIAWPDAPSDEYLAAVGLNVDRIVRLPRTGTLRTVWYFLRARAVFYSHSIYGNPVPVKRRPIVNIWHGDGFKGGKLFPDRTLRGPSSTYILSASSLIGKYKVNLAGLSEASLLLVGNPRTAQMDAPARPDELKRVGIDCGRPFVVWMPTFRVARDGDGGIAFMNTDDPGADDALARTAESIAVQLGRAGFNLVVKPHRLDATNRAVAGATIIDDDLLTEHAVPLYRLLGASAGLISDYSSVWIDYLYVDRPIGFLINDLAGFRRGREVLAPELISQYPGEVLDSDDRIQYFIADLAARGARDRDRRRDFKRLIGYVESSDSGDDLVRTALGISA